MRQWPFWFPKLHGITPLWIHLLQTGMWVLVRATQLPSVRVSFSQDHALQPRLWVRFCPKITPIDIFSDGSHDQWRGGKAKLRPLAFWGSLVFLGKLVPFPTQALDDVAWGRIYTNNEALPVSRSPSGEFRCQVPSLGAVIAVSTRTMTVCPGRHRSTYNIVPSFKSIRGFPYRPLHEFFVKTERLSLPIISKRTR